MEWILIGKYLCCHKRIASCCGTVVGVTLQRHGIAALNG
jgi:hypothetical protein